MTLDEAIKHEEETADNLEREAKCIRSWGKENDTKQGAINCEKCAEEHRQLAEWLKELKQLREQIRWIPINERPPEKDVDVLVTDDAGGLATVHIDSYGEREESKEGFWYISQNVTAWKYFPQPYKAESEVKE